MGESEAALPVEEFISKYGVVKAIQAKRAASLLMTYRCTLACAHCLFNCGPHQPRRYHSVEQGVRYLRMLHTTDRVVHIAGGEAMMEYETVLAICREAATHGAAPHFIETNATWCTNAEGVRRRLNELKDVGVRGLYISADPFHLTFLPVDRYRRCYEAAVELFGERNVMAPRATRQELREMQQIGRDPQRLAEYVRKSPPQMVGRAGEELARFLPPRPIEEFGGDRLWQGEPPGMSCRREFDPDTMWEIHIDPYHNIQTCCGVILGDARRRPLSNLMAAGFSDGNPIVAALCEEGPVGLLKMAEGLGYQREEYVQKCHLCWQVRRFLRPHFPDILGPDEIYGPQGNARPP